MEEWYVICRSLISLSIISLPLGLPVVLSPKQPGKFPVDDPTIGQDPQRNNNFDYGARTESPRQQFLCPFAAHTRKAGPRTDLPLAADEQHAILRAGMPVDFFFATTFVLTVISDRDCVRSRSVTRGVLAE